MVNYSDSSPKNMPFKKISSANIEALILLFVFLIVAFFSMQLDLFETIFELLGEDDRYEIDEIVLVTAIFSLFTTFYAIRRWLESKKLFKDQENSSIALRDANLQLNAKASELFAKQERNEQLSQMISFLQVCKSKEEAFQHINKSAMSIFKDCSGALYVTKESRDQLNLASHWGDATYPDLFIPDDCWGLRRGKPFFSSQDWATPLCNHINSEDNRISACYPLVAYGEIIGLFHLRFPEIHTNKVNKAISSAFEQTLSMFCEQVSLSISNLELHYKLQHLAVIDPLTGLYNRHYLEETFEREIHRAKRKGKKLGIVMMDLDHFKSFNDTYGHPAGDMVLREVGKFIRAYFRIDDFCCRYGGEEFFVLITDIETNDVIKKCESLRQGIENLSVIYRNTPLKRITGTLGVAIYPDHGDSTSLLIESADNALYRGKKAGRNRVQFAS